MTDLRWRPITEYKPGPYRGYDEIVLVGWTDLHHGGVLGFALAWFDLGGAWIDKGDRCRFVNEPDLFALVVQDIPGTVDGYVASLEKKA